MNIVVYAESTFNYFQHKICSKFSFVFKIVENMVYVSVRVISHISKLELG